MPQYVLRYYDMSWNTTICPGVPWCVPGYDGVSSGTTIFPCICVCSAVRHSLRLLGDINSLSLIFSGVSWRLSIFSLFLLVSRFRPTPLGISRNLSVFFIVFQCLSMLFSMCRNIPSMLTLEELKLALAIVNWLTLITRATTIVESSYEPLTPPEWHHSLIYILEYHSHYMWSNNCFRKAAGRTIMERSENYKIQ